MKHPTPNLFIVGAAKAGTTFLFEELSRHPDVFACPVKEPRHFSAPCFESLPCSEAFRQELTPDREAYLALFQEGRNHRYRMECSVFYMAFPTLAAELKAFDAEARIVMGLRHPVDRLVSHYEQHHTQKGIDRRTFEEFLEHPYSMEGLNLMELGRYTRQVEPYIEHFGAAQFHWVLQDDLRSEPEQVMKKLHQFLGLSPRPLSGEAERNPGGLPRSEWLHTLTNRENRWRRWIRLLLPVGFKIAVRRAINRRNLVKSSLSSDVRQRLIDYYRDDIQQLASLIRRDLSAWLK